MNLLSVLFLIVSFGLFSTSLWAESAPTGFEKVDEEVTISTLASQMKYDVESFSVKPNSKVKIIFKNPDSLPHNLILCTPGKKKGGDKGQEVMDAVYKLGDQGVKMNWEPTGHPRILASSGMVQPGDEKTIYFKVPRIEGDYPYICTFPGHHTLMNGLMAVTKRPNAITNLRYKIYHGSWKEMPDFTMLEPKKTGALPNGLFDISRAELPDNFAFVFKGFIQCPKDGNYTFATASDDGSQLLINQQMVVNNDGLHGVVTRSGSIALSKGKHEIEVRYFEFSGFEKLHVSWSGPGFKNKLLTKDFPGKGKVVKSIPISPEGGEAIIYRNFIDGAGPRAIGVGYDEGVNLAFDANNMRLAMIWYGQFMDGGRHWTARGQGFQPPAGKGVVRLPEGEAFANLTSQDSNWPAVKYRTQDFEFCGYELDDRQRPTFKYRKDNLSISDQFIPIPGFQEAQPGKIKRVLQLQGEPGGGNLYFRVAQGAFTRVGNLYKSNALNLEIKGADGINVKNELRIPILFKGNQARLELDYSWAVQ